MTDGASLRRRQEDLWQGLDAAIKSQEMYRASPPPPLSHLPIFFLSLALRFPSPSAALYLLLAVPPIHPRPITSLRPSSYPLPIPLFLCFSLLPHTANRAAELSASA